MQSRRKVNTNNRHLGAQYNSHDEREWNRLVSTVRNHIENKYGDEIEYQEQREVLAGTRLLFTTSIPEKQLKALGREITLQMRVPCTVSFASSGSASHLTNASFILCKTPLQKNKWTRTAIITFIIVLMCYVAFSGYQRFAPVNNNV